MGRLQSSVGLVTGTNIQSTVDQLIAISGRSRDRVVARTETLQREQTAIADLTATVIGVQLAGNRLSNASAFQAKQATSSNAESLSVAAGRGAAPAEHVVRTLQTAATHTVRSRQRFESTSEALGLSGQLRVNPTGGFIDGSADLSKLNNGRGVEAGQIRITDRSGESAVIDLSSARTIDDVLTAINDADIDVRATTENGAIKLVDETGRTESNLRVEQLGDAETAADLGLFGIDDAADSVVGLDFELPAGVESLRGTALSKLGGGNGIGTLGNLDITLSDGSSASIDLSAATTTSDVIDAIEGSGLSLIVRYNDARNGLQIRDVSGGNGNLTISSSDSTADAIGLAADTTDDIVVGRNLNRQTVTESTLLADLNQGDGVTGSFTIRDSRGSLSAVNVRGSGITTVGELIERINSLSVDVTASINETGDGIQIVDNAAGSETLTITDVGTGTAARDLGVAGTATTQTIAGSSVSALVGSQAGVIEIGATDSLADVVEKLNESGRYGEASIQSNDDGTFSLRIRSNRGGEQGRFAINSTGFSFDLQTEARGRDALIAVATDQGLERFLTSSDGVFTIDGTGTQTELVTNATRLTDLAGGASGGSFTLTDSDGRTSAINITTQGITTVGGLIEAINRLNIGVQASINDDGTGITVVDTAGGDEDFVIRDVGNAIAARSLGIAGTATTTTVDGAEVRSLTGPAERSTTNESSGLTFTLRNLTDSPITVSVTEDTSGVETATRTFVDQYNRLIDRLDSLTFFNADTNEVGLLFGSNEAQRITSGFSRLLSGAINGAGPLRSIGQVGISFGEGGKLQLDQARLSEALTERREDVQAFFATEGTGLANRINVLSERIAGVDNGLLLTRTDTIGTQIQRNTAQVDTLNSRLERERERLLNQFFATETAISRLQSNQSAIGQIERIEFPS